MVVSQAAFTLNDTLVKLATSTVGVGQIMFVRGVFATAMMALLVWKLRQFQPWSRVRNPAVMSRIGGEIGGTIFFLLALAHLPLANVSAIFQSLPLAVTMCAALFLGETVGPRRWTAIAIGFVGVLIIVRPGLAGFNAYSIYVLLAVAFCAFRDLATRRIPKDIPSSFVSLLTAGVICMSGIFLTPFTGGWVDLTPQLLLTLAGAAVLVLTGYQFIISSMREGDISYIAPFRYTALIWAIASGVIVFGKVPDVPMLIGSTIVVGSGIYMIFRERTVGREKPAAESIESTIAADGL